jgi:hypothetical protein
MKLDLAHKISTELMHTCLIMKYSALTINSINKEKVAGIVPAEVQKNKEKARNLLMELEKLLVPGAGPWLYSATVPTALDAHLVAFIARLRDLRKEDLVPQALIGIATKPWKLQSGGV